MCSKKKQKENLDTLRGISYNGRCKANKVKIMKTKTKNPNQLDLFNQNIQLDLFKEIPAIAPEIKEEVLETSKTIKKEDTIESLCKEMANADRGNETQEILTKINKIIKKTTNKDYPIQVSYIKLNSHYQGTKTVDIDKLKELNIEIIAQVDKYSYFIEMPNSYTGLMYDNAKGLMTKGYILNENKIPILEIKRHPFHEDFSQTRIIPEDEIIEL